MIKRIVLLVMIFSLSLASPALAVAPDQGIIEGLVVNKTASGSSVVDLELTLKAYLDNTEVDSTTTKTDAGGQFVFDGLSTEPGYSYQVTLTFQQAEYNSDWLSFGEGETTRTVEVTVYDSTTSDEAVKVAMAHTIIYVGQDSLEVMEYFLFVNEADRTYIGSEEAATGESGETLKFSLSREATEVQITLGLMECCIVANEEGFGETMPILPGSREVAYSYRVNHSSGKYTFSQNVNYPTAKYDLLFQGEVIEVISGQLAAAEPMDIEGTQFTHLSGSDFARGDILVVQLSDLPEADNQGVIIWVALTLVVLTGGFGYLLRRRRGQPVSLEDSLDQRRRGLLVELAQLDDDFERGEIPEEDYRRLRAVRKSQLVELMQGAKEEGGNG